MEIYKMIDNERKKELRETYKQTPRTAGVIAIRNKENGKVFITASVDVNALINRCRAELNFGGHKNTVLQQDWKSLGPDSFEIEILDTLEPEEQMKEVSADDVNELFELWMAKIEPYGDKGYH
jgi:hypothetical protein